MDKTVHVVRRQTQGRVIFGPAYTTRALLDLSFPNVDVQSVRVRGDLNGCKKLFAHVTPGERAQQLLGLYTSLEMLRSQAEGEAPHAVVEIRLEG